MRNLSPGHSKSRRDRSLAQERELNIRLNGVPTQLDRHITGFDSYQNRGTYPCEMCGKRSWISREPSVGIGLCVPCYDAAGQENEHQDGLHDRRVRECPICYPGLERARLKAARAESAQVPASPQAPAPQKKEPVLVEVVRQTMSRRPQHAAGCRCVECKMVPDADGPVRTLVPASRVRAEAKRERELHAKHVRLGRPSVSCHECAMQQPDPAPEPRAAVEGEAAIKRAIKIAFKQGRRFTARDVFDATPTADLLYEAAFAFLDTYDGDDEYILQFQEVADDTEELTSRQCARVLNCMLRTRVPDIRERIS